MSTVSSSTMAVVAVFQDLYGNLWDLLEPREEWDTPAAESAMSAGREP